MLKKLLAFLFALGILTIPASASVYKIISSDGSVIVSNPFSIVNLRVAAGSANTRPIYNLNGTPITMKAIRVTGTVSSSLTVCGPYFNSYCVAITLPTSQAFTSVSSTATSFDCGGGESLAAVNYWLHDFNSFSVEWNNTTTLYVAGGAASEPFSFICEGT